MRTNSLNKPISSYSQARKKTGSHRRLDYKSHSGSRHLFGSIHNDALVLLCGSPLCLRFGDVDRVSCLLKSRQEETISGKSYWQGKCRDTVIDHSPTKYGKNNSCLDRPLCIIVLKILMKLKVKYGTNNSDLDKPVFIFAHEGSNDIKSSCPVKCTGVNLPRSKSLRLLRSRSRSCCLFLPFHLLKIRTVILS